MSFTNQKAYNPSSFYYMCLSRSIILLARDKIFLFQLCVEAENIRAEERKNSNLAKVSFVRLK